MEVWGSQTEPGRFPRRSPILGVFHYEVFMTPRVVVGGKELSPTELTASMFAGCAPVVEAAERPIALYERLLKTLDRLGQEDGNWAEDAALNDMVLTDHPVLAELRPFVPEAYVPALTKAAAALIDAEVQMAREADEAVRLPVDLNVIAGDMAAMEEDFGLEFAFGWKIFPIHIASEDRYMVRGCLFPSDGKPDYACWFTLDEIFPSTKDRLWLLTSGVDEAIEGNVPEFWIHSATLIDEGAEPDEEIRREQAMRLLTQASDLMHCAGFLLGTGIAAVESFVRQFPELTDDERGSLVFRPFGGLFPAEE